MTQAYTPPTYIPPHLAGKVYDFRQEPSGDYSFAYPEASMGLGPDKSRQVLTPEQYKNTFDADHRRRNFNSSMAGQYSGMTERPGNRSGQLSDWLGGKISDGYNWSTSTTGKSVAATGLLSALAGAAAGAYIGNQQGEGVVSKSLAAALLAGAAGAGISAYSHGAAERRSSFLAKQANQEVDFIIEAITEDRSLSPTEKAQCLRAVVSLGTVHRAELSRMLSTATGAGIGMLIMRFLRGKGLIHTAVGGMMGALAGYMSSGGPKYNPMGQLTLSNYR
jgi:hypothetical protein